MAELIEAQDADHKALVAEVGGLAIGFMCVSTEVDVDLLNTCFELKPYTYLHKVEKKVEEDAGTSIATDRLVQVFEYFVVRHISFIIEWQVHIYKCYNP